MLSFFKKTRFFELLQEKLYFCKIADENFTKSNIKIYGKSQRAIWTFNGLKPGMRRPVRIVYKGEIVAFIILFQQNSV